MNSGGYLVLRRAGALWAIDGALVRGVERHGGTTSVATAAGALLADAVIGLVPSLEVRRPAAGVGSYLAPGVAGLTVHEGACVAIIDPARPPAALQPAPPEAAASRPAVRRRPAKPATRVTRREGSGDGNVQR